MFKNIFKSSINKKSNISNHHVVKKFDFAFSFSGEEVRKKVLSVVKKLEQLGFSVFVDKLFTKEMQKTNHPKEYLKNVFQNANHVILVLNNRYMRMLEIDYDCKKDFNQEKGCYIKLEMKIIADRYKQKNGNEFLMRINIEKDRFDLSKYGINTDAYYQRIDINDILDFFDYKDKLQELEFCKDEDKEKKLILKEKFYKLIDFHIKREEIPLIFDEFSYDIIYKDKFYEIITPELINNIASKFQVNKQVFFNNSEEFYPKANYGFYKNVKNFSNFIYNDIFLKGGKMYIIAERVPNKNIDERNNDNFFALIFKIPLFGINGKQIYSFKIYDDSCMWGYWKCRYNLKSLLLCLRNKGVDDNFWQGNIIKNKESLYENLLQLSYANKTLNEIINNRIDWYPEDFIDLPSQSVKAQEIDELKDILKEEECKSFY